MTVQTIAITADVPEDQDVAAQAAAASFVTSFTADVEGATVLAATYGGASLLPSPADEWAAAVADLDALKSGRPTAADVARAVERVQGAAKAYELSLSTTVPGAAGPATAPDAAATLAATTVSNAAEPAPPVQTIPVVESPSAIPSTQPAPATPAGTDGGNPPAEPESEPAA